MANEGLPCLLNFRLGLHFDAALLHKLARGIRVIPIRRDVFLALTIGKPMEIWFCLSRPFT